jgi:hypothetical protein
VAGQRDCLLSLVLLTLSSLFPSTFSTHFSPSSPPRRAPHPRDPQKRTQVPLAANRVRLSHPRASPATSSPKETQTTEDAGSRTHASTSIVTSLRKSSEALDRYGGNIQGNILLYVVFSLSATSSFPPFHCRYWSPSLSPIVRRKERKRRIRTRYDEERPGRRRMTTRICTDEGGMKGIKTIGRRE